MEAAWKLAQWDSLENYIAAGFYLKVIQNTCTVTKVFIFVQGVGCGSVFYYIYTVYQLVGGVCILQTNNSSSLLHKEEYFGFLFFCCVAGAHLMTARG